MKRKSNNINLRAYPETFDAIKHLQHQVFTKTGMTLTTSDIVETGVHVLANMKIERVFQEVNCFRKSVDVSIRK